LYPSSSNVWKHWQLVFAAHSGKVEGQTRDNHLGCHLGDPRYLNRP
jgi:hypothetical protein